MKLLPAISYFFLAIGMVIVSADEPGGKRPASEWLEEVRVRLATEPDAERSALLKSVVLSPQSKFTGVEYDPGLYLKWKEGEGASLLSKLLEDEDLAPSERGDEQLAEYILLKQARDAGLPKIKAGQPAPAGFEQLREYWDKANREGLALLRSAYPTGLLDARDIGILRRYWMVTVLMGTSAPAVPFEVRLEGNLVEVGQPAPSFDADRLESWDVAAVLKTANPNRVYDHVTDWVLLEPLQLLMSYEADGNSGRVRPRQNENPLKDAGNAFRLAGTQRKKPLVLLFAHPSDFWAYHFTLAVEFDLLARAAGHLADFVFVNVSVHDTLMPVLDPFPASANAGRLAQSTHNSLVFHPVDSTERVRAAGLMQLAIPFFSVPMVLDNMGQTIRNSYRERGGEATMVLIDVDGRVVYRDRNDVAPKSQFYKEYRWQRLQALAARISDLALAGGRDTDPISWQAPEFWKIGALEPGSDGPQSGDPGVPRASLVVGGLVTSVSGEAVEITDPTAFGPGLELWDRIAPITPVGAETSARLETLRSWRSMGVPLRYQVLESAVVIRNGRVSGRKDIRPGDRVGLRTRAIWGGLKSIPVDMIFAFGQ